MDSEGSNKRQKLDSTDGSSYISSKVSSLLESSKYSDLTITCQDRTFKVHKAIICGQSAFFEGLCKNEFQESTSGEVNLKDDEPEDVGRMVKFLYTGKYDYESESATSPPASVDPLKEPDSLACQHINVAMFALGEKYLIPHLKTIAAVKFASLKASSWIHGVADILRQVYGTTPSTERELRRLLINICVNNDINDESEDYRAALKEFPEAHVEILQEKLSVKEAININLRSGLETVLAQKTALENSNTQLKQEKQRLFNWRVEQSTRADTERGWGIGRYQEFIDTINSGACRHCHEEFGIHIDDRDNDYNLGELMVRCSQCNTRN